jgi:hypothetical protein
MEGWLEQVFGKCVRGSSSDVFYLFEGTEDDHGKSQFHDQYLAESQTRDLLNMKQKVPFNTL